MNTRTRGYLITILASIAWGFSGVCSEFLMKDYGANPYWLTAMRMLLAAPTTMGFLLFKDRGFSALHRSLLRNRRSYLPMVIYSVLGLAGSQLTYVVAIGYSNAGTATVIEFLGPILIVVFVCITARRLPKYTELFAITFALLGTFILADRLSGDLYRCLVLGSCQRDRFRSLHVDPRQTHPPLRQRTGRCVWLYHRRNHLRPRCSRLVLLHQVGFHVGDGHGRTGLSRHDLRIHAIPAGSRRYRPGTGKPHFLPSANFCDFLFVPSCWNPFHACRYRGYGFNFGRRYYCQSQGSYFRKATGSSFFYRNGRRKSNIRGEVNVDIPSGPQGDG